MSTLVLHTRVLIMHFMIYRWLPMVRGVVWVIRRQRADAWWVRGSIGHNARVGWVRRCVRIVRVMMVLLGDVYFSECRDDDRQSAHLDLGGRLSRRLVHTSWWRDGLLLLQPAQLRWSALSAFHPTTVWHRATDHKISVCSI